MLLKEAVDLFLEYLRVEQNRSAAVLKLKESGVAWGIARKR